jgi:hypothetical protein
MVLLGWLSFSVFLSCNAITTEDIEMIYTLFFIERCEPVDIPVWLGVYTSIDETMIYAWDHDLNDPEREGYYSIMESELDNPMTAKRVLRIPEEE